MVVRMKLEEILSRRKNLTNKSVYIHKTKDMRISVCVIVFFVKIYFDDLFLL